MKTNDHRPDLVRGFWWIRAIAIFLVIARGNVGICEDSASELDQSLFVSVGESYSLVPESVHPVTGIKITVADVRHSKPGWKVVTLRSDKDIEGLFLLASNHLAHARFPVRFERNGDHWEYSFDAMRRVDAAITISGSTYFFEATEPSLELTGDHPEPRLLYTPSIFVPPDFFTALTSGLEGAASVESGLIMRGVELPPGAAVLRGAATGQFLMRNTESNHEKLSEFITEHWGEANPKK